MKIGEFFSNEFETKDKHQNINLQTRYYRADVNKAINEYKYLMNKMGFELLEELPDYHELHYYKPHVEVIASIYSESYFVQGFDFKVNTSYLFPRGRGIKEIVKMYEEIEKVLERVK